MSNKLKRIKSVGKNIVIQSIGETKVSKIHVPEVGAFRDHKAWLTRDCTVYSISEDVTKVMKGDKVLLDPLSKLRQRKNLKEIMPEILKRPLKVEKIKAEGKITGVIGKLEEKPIEAFFIVKEDDVLAILE